MSQQIDLARQSVGFDTASQVKKAVEVLVREDVVIKNGTYCIQDILFEKWIRTLM